jgi:hypothetical protein
MSYDTKMHAWTKMFGPDAIQRLFEEYAEICLSLPLEKEIADALIAQCRLRPEEPESAEHAYAILEYFFAEMIVEGRIKFSECGLSIVGREQLNHLVSLIPRDTPQEPAPPVDEFAEVTADYANMRAENFKAKWMKSPEAEATFNRAIAAGRIV